MQRRTRGWSVVALLGGVAGIALATYVLIGATSRHPPRRVSLPRCALGPTTPGIDVSYYQGEIAWRRVRASGVRFAFIRVADGTQILDTRFVDNWTRARRAGVLRGAYQYFRPRQNPTDQADLVIRMLRAHGAGELPPVLDLEETGGLPLATVIERASVWIEHVRAALGVEPIVYTNPAMWRSRARGAGELAAQPLWLAHYTNRCPDVPAPWERWHVWQYTDEGRVPGIEGPVDLDVFVGTVEELRRRWR